MNSQIRAGVARLRARHVLMILAALAALPIGFGGCAVPSSPYYPDDNDSVELAEALSEADVVKYEGGYFYIANPFSGLQIIDGRDMTSPTLVGSDSLQGRTVELLLKDENALLVTAADFLTCAGEPIGFDDDSIDDIIRPNYTGSRLYILDVSDKTTIRQRRVRGIEGYATATRIVGDVVYVAGYTTTDGTPDKPKAGAFLTSIDIADPDNAVITDREEFVGGANDVLLSESAIYVVGDDPDVDDTTLVTYVDISDPTGAMTLRDQFRVPGLVQGRSYYDELDGTLRIVTGELDRYHYNDGTSYAYAKAVSLYTYDVTDPDNVTRTARLGIDAEEEVRAVSFDGTRAFVATSNYEMPLFVLDLSDPADPKIDTRLESPGRSAHFVPAENKLIGLGLSYQDGIRPAVALYDVTPGQTPRLQDRVVLGPKWYWEAGSEAFVDPKALRVVAESSLILLPFSTFDNEQAAFVDSVQLISWSGSELTEQGFAEHTGLVRRAGVEDGFVWALSDLSFQTIDIEDMDKPTSLRRVELVSEQELLDAGLSGCSDSARQRGEDVYYGYYDYYGGCGYIMIPPLFGMVAGLVGMRLTRRRA